MYGRVCVGLHVQALPFVIDTLILTSFLLISVHCSSLPEGNVMNAQQMCTALSFDATLMIRDDD